MNAFFYIVFKVSLTTYSCFFFVYLLSETAIVNMFNKLQTLFSLYEVQMFHQKMSKNGNKNNSQSRYSHTIVVHA